MQLDKSQVLEFLRNQGKTTEADQADSELPDQVDTEQHGNLLQKFGIDPMQLVQQFMGGKGIPGL